MFEDLQKKLGVAYLFIAHDLLVVHHISDRIAVMYLGKMMELADADELNDNPIPPLQPRACFRLCPSPTPRPRARPSASCSKAMCPARCTCPAAARSAPGCRYATEQCAKEMPPFTDRGNGHFVACWNK